MFLCGVLGLFFWQSTIYPVSGQTGSEPVKGTAKVNQTQKVDSTNKLNQNQIVIQKGDTLWSLAQKYQLSLDQLTQINNIAYPDHIRVGQKLYVQAQKPSRVSILSQVPELSPNQSPSQTQTHTVQTENISEVKMYEIIMGEIPYPSRGMQVQEQPIREENSKSATLNEQTPKEQNQNGKTEQEQTSEKQAAGEQVSEAQMPKMKATQAEIDLLARVIYAEARGENFEGQVAVGAVVLNRLEDSNFPKTIKGVIYQPGAFTAVIDKQIHLTPNEEAYRAAETALAGEDPTGGALYYFNPKTATDRWIKSRAVLKQIGNHTFSI